MALFYLGAVAAHLRWADGRGMRGWMSPVLFATALAAKETAVTLPLALLAWEIACGAGLREALHRTRRAWLVLACGAMAMLSSAGYRRLLDVSVTTRTLKENLLTQIDGVSYLLTQPMLLLRTNIDPGQGLVLAALLVVSIVLLRRRPWAGLGGVWVFLHVLPTNSFLPRLDVANDRQLYLALIGVAVPASIALWRLRPALVPGAIAASLSLLLAGATIARNMDYRNEVALWQATVARAPDNARAWNNLGFALRLDGDAARARSAFLRALALSPDYAKARLNLEAIEAQQADRP
jgi:tetratricopeptide (TPR) repeat protein